MAERTARGETVREDWADPENGDAAALFEAVVEAAAKSAEDRKCEAIANLYASIALRELISIDDALLYVRRTRDSSWRQLVALQFLVAVNRRDERETVALAGRQGDADASSALAAELTELAEALGLAGIQKSPGFAANPTGGEGFRSEGLDQWTATDLGQRLAGLAGLQSVVKDEDLDELARDLSAPLDWGY